VYVTAAPANMKYFLKDHNDDVIKPKMLMTILKHLIGEAILQRTTGHMRLTRERIGSFNAKQRPSCSSATSSSAQCTKLLRKMLKDLQTSGASGRERD